jgi:hypothetical protein
MRNARVRNLRRRFWVPGLPHVVVEKNHPFDPSVLELKGNIYLVGYWQSEKYFQEIADTVRHDFCFKNPPAGPNAATAAHIRATCSICVHVRRTDYITDPCSNRLIGTCSPEYYRSAAQFVASRLPNPHFFVFSDEPDWARANLMLPGPASFVADNDLQRGYEDLRLMTLCQHHIIANSTLSWWGAWLSSSGGITIAPKKWFKGDEVDTRDVVPERWVRL